MCLPVCVCVLFICNVDYFPKFVQTYYQLRTVGKYDGDVCLIVCDDLANSDMLLEFTKENDIIIKYFPEIKYPPHFYEQQRAVNRDAFWNAKMFQYNKYYVFHTDFKAWDYVFYLDCGIHIFSDITPILKTHTPNTLLAHSNTYPYYEITLRDGFDNTKPIAGLLEKEYNLCIDYPQTTIMYYDTKIITDNTIDDLIQLSIKYPISITNDQSIIALYFTCVRPLWKQIPLGDDNIMYYDYLRRGNNKKYIMVKVNHIRENNKKIEFI